MSITGADTNPVKPGNWLRKKIQLVHPTLTRGGYPEETKI